jgi:multidrug efflux pump subunit AcrA (membrane-fusion protein)
MQFFSRPYTNLTKRFGTFLTNTVLILLILIGIVAIVRMGGDTVTEEVLPTPAPRTVSLYTIGDADGTAVRTADGNAFIVRAESGGRVDRIAAVGDTVLRGAVVAQLENSAQRAAVLQAQGAYEAALAGANQSGVGKDAANRAYEEAQTQAVNTYRSAFATTDDVLRNTVDQVFSQPDIRPGLKIDGQGQANALNEERSALEVLFDNWRNSVGTVRSERALTVLETAESHTSRLNAFVISLNALLSDDKAINDEVLLASLRSDFATARTTLNGVLATLSSTRSALIQAETAKEQADIAGSGEDVSLADAQVKQALGVLQSAQAALSKTAVKTPVAGTVTGVSISVGDIITVGSDVVFVASDAAVETANTVTVPLTAVKFTPTKAFIFTVEEGKLVAHEVTTGAVTTKSITISHAEGITDIVLDVRGLKEGDPVVTQ